MKFIEKFTALRAGVLNTDNDMQSQHTFALNRLMEDESELVSDLAASAYSLTMAPGF